MKQWQTFLSWFSWSLTGLLVFFGLLIWVVDPYQNIPFSPPLERAPAASNQRYAYPAIARSAAFDSAIIGTSTMRLIPPDAVNRAIGGRFANLSMNSATAYEQMKIGQVFAQHHPAAKTLIVGIDIVWCETGEKVEKYTFRRFPEWMYDASPWNDLLQLLEFKTFEVLGRQAGYLLGLRGSRYGQDGYRNFLPPPSSYDLKKARLNIYGPEGKRAPLAASSADSGKAVAPKFPAHDYLYELLAAFPQQTRKVLVLVPYHRHHQPAPGTERAMVWEVCADRIAAIAQKFNNAVFLDFMIGSPITRKDENYWDALHTTNGVAEQVARLIATGMSGKPAPNGEYRIRPLR